MLKKSQGRDSAEESINSTGSRVSQSKPRSFLPNFCDNRVVMLIVLVAELLAVILTLTATSNTFDFWLHLALISLFIQWIALGTAAALCAVDTWLARLSVPSAALAAFALTQLITLLFSLLALWFMELAGYVFELDSISHPYFVLRNLAISSIVFLVALRYFYIQHQWKRNVEAEARSRLKALQDRIRPHFLFNSMNTIASLIYDRPEQAEEATLDLADLFRSSLQENDKINLKEELEIVRRYLRIEALRLGERLRVDWRLDDNLPLDTMMPALILQPLVENAVYHGIQPLLAGGLISIRIAAPNGALTFNVINPLPESDGGQRWRGSGVAQENVRQRLALAYGQDSAMTIQQADGEYRVSFTIPKRAS